MNTRLKKILIIIVGLIAFLFLGVVFINITLENKIKNQLDHIADNVEIEYKKIKVNSLKGRVNISKPLISVYGKTTHKKNAIIELENFLVDGFSYWNYYFGDRIKLENIVFNQPKIIYHHNDSVKSKSYQETIQNKLNQIIKIETIKVNGGNIEVYNILNDSLILKSENVNFNINEFGINQSNKKKLITYKDFKGNTNSIIYKLNNYDNLYLGHIDFSTHFSKLKEIRLKTKYSKEELSNQIPVERDHFNLTIDSLEIKNYDFGFKQDSLFYFNSQRVDFYNPDFKIYRDKLVADDLTYKPLYSKMLRDLNFNMTLDTIFLNNSTIVYTEKVKPNTKGGRLIFSKLNAEIKNLSNTYKTDKAITSANIEAVFMNNAKINSQWYFNVNNMQDEFIYKAEVRKLNAESMNQFMEPNLKVRLEGEIQQTYFTINGNDYNSQVDLKIKYDDFDVVVLKDNGKEKNKFLSSLVNIFVSEDSKGDSDAYRYASKSDIKRSNHKSVFNYLWLNIRAGLMKAITGDGEKNDK